MAQLREGSVIKKVGGDEVIATVEDIDISSTQTQEILDSKADKSQVLTNVPANAKFTDTIDHTHGNKATIDKFTESGGKPLYNGKEIGVVPAGGSSTFKGNNTEQTIAHGLGVIPSSASAFPTVKTDGYLGEIWIRFDAVNIYVGNTGSYTGGMCWMAIP